VVATAPPASVAAVIHAVLHLQSDQPLSVDLLEEPTPTDIAVICTNVRSLDGKKPVFIDHSGSTFVFPMAMIRFVEIVRAGAAEERMRPVAVPGEADDTDDLEIDEDFLRRVREA
jgi:hypothetical protein